MPFATLRGGASPAVGFFSIRFFDDHSKGFQPNDLRTFNPIVYTTPLFATVPNQPPSCSRCDPIVYTTLFRATVSLDVIYAAPPAIQPRTSQRPGKPRPGPLMRTSVAASVLPIFQPSDPWEDHHERRQDAPCLPALPPVFEPGHASASPSIRSRRNPDQC